MSETSRADVERDYEEYRAEGRVWGQVPIERIAAIKFPRASREIVEEFLTFEDLSTTVSDALDSLGLRGAVAGSHLKPVIAGRKMVGTATTVRSIPERKTPTQGYFDKDMIKMSTRESYYLGEPGDVLICDFGGNLDVSNMGGQSVTVARSRGFAGAIVNGAVRDVSTIKKIDYPVWSKGVTPITGKFRMEAVEMNGPVTVHDVAVYPGDLVVADDSGVCFVPYEHIGYVLEQLRAIAREEENMRELIESKRPLDELRPLYRKRYS
ncbi:RraA family protein [Arsenicitalea aurantiaca]|uniref:Putative 4-hydroxy-4-methyl-2-oxoglutarate aldolase n=1 Tax=Arsenicitalea aurantiaca TaxID=1783274 RepID=A0A433X7Q3_9HYPH|nr:RraA family protein [Arsenicitalea aurantiaca]RUT30089.1 RraA family protein [Arsenicitalea aurantiaca]